MPGPSIRSMRVSEQFSVAWRVATELHTAQWVIMGIFGILPASAAGVLLSVWGEHSASLILLICVIIFFIFATLGLSFLGYVEETRVRSSSRRAIDRSAPPLIAHAQQPPQFRTRTTHISVGPRGSRPARRDACAPGRCGNACPYLRNRRGRAVGLSLHP
jgi:hypothetical protein